MNNDKEQNTNPLPPALSLQQPQKRIPALSVRGDAVWQISEPVLNWMIANGDQSLSHQAFMTKALWEAEQGWFIEWGNQTRYFEQAERACYDLAGYKAAMKAIPSDNPGVQRIRELALMTGEAFNKPIGIGRKNSVWHRKQSRGKRQ